MTQTEAFARLVRWVKERDRSVADVRERLARLAFPEQEIEAAIKKATELGYLNDRRAGESLVQREVAKHSSRAAIVQKLHAAGLEDATLEDSGVNDAAAAKALLQKRKLHGVKAARFLASRAFDESLIRQLVTDIGESE